MTKISVKVNDEEPIEVENENIEHLIISIDGRALFCGQLTPEDLQGLGLLMSNLNVDQLAKIVSTVREIDGDPNQYIPLKILGTDKYQLKDALDMMNSLFPKKKGRETSVKPTGGLLDQQEKEE